MMWLLVANGLLYLGFLYLHGEWRDLVPRRGDARDAIEMIKFYLFVRRDHPHQGKHNALQKSAYFAMPILGVIIVLSGLAIWKPVTLGFITRAVRELQVGALRPLRRRWSLLLLLALVHVFMVFSVDPYSLRSMITGWYNRARSPEARNARPFYHLFGPARKSRAARAEVPTP